MVSTDHKGMVHRLVISHTGIRDNNAKTTKTGYFPFLSAKRPTKGALKIVSKPPRNKSEKDHPDDTPHYPPMKAR